MIREIKSKEEKFNMKVQDGLATREQAAAQDAAHAAQDAAKQGANIRLRRRRIIAAQQDTTRRTMETGGETKAREPGIGESKTSASGKAEVDTSKLAPKNLGAEPTSLRDRIVKAHNITGDKEICFQFPGQPGTKTTNPEPGMFIIDTPAPKTTAPAHSKEDSAFINNLRDQNPGHFDDILASAKASNIDRADLALAMSSLDIITATPAFEVDLSSEGLAKDKANISLLSHRKDKSPEYIKKLTSTVANEMMPKLLEGLALMGRSAKTNGQVLLIGQVGFERKEPGKLTSSKVAFPHLVGLCKANDPTTCIAFIIARNQVSIGIRASDTLGMGGFMAEELGFAFKFKVASHEAIKNPNWKAIQDVTAPPPGTPGVKIQGPKGSVYSLELNRSTQNSKTSYDHDLGGDIEQGRKRGDMKIILPDSEIEKTDSAGKPIPKSKTPHSKKTEEFMDGEKKTAKLVNISLITQTHFQAGLSASMPNGLRGNLDARPGTSIGGDVFVGQNYNLTQASPKRLKAIATRVGIEVAVGVLVHAAVAYKIGNKLNNSVIGGFDVGHAAGILARMVTRRVQDSFVPPSARNKVANLSYDPLDFNKMISKETKIAFPGATNWVCTVNNYNKLQRIIGGSPDNVDSTWPIKLKEAVASLDLQVKKLEQVISDLKANPDTSAAGLETAHGIASELEKEYDTIGARVVLQELEQHNDLREINVVLPERKIALTDKILEIEADIKANERDLNSLENTEENNPMAEQLQTEFHELQVELNKHKSTLNIDNLALPIMVKTADENAQILHDTTKEAVDVGLRLDLAKAKYNEVKADLSNIEINKINLKTVKQSHSSMTKEKDYLDTQKRVETFQALPVKQREEGKKKLADKKVEDAATTSVENLIEKTNIKKTN